jgi:hypothetical protein
VAPPADAMVSPNVVSSEARVMVVLRYCWAAIVPVQESSHSVPVPQLDNRESMAVSLAGALEIPTLSCKDPT